MQTQLAVIGAGLAGLSASLFACRRGLSTVVVGGTSEVVYAAGPWDLLGVHPIERRRWVADPWLGVEALARDVPSHPYSRTTEPQVRSAFAVVLEAFRDVGYPYERLADVNCEVVTSLGTRKRTYCLPHTMWGAVQALQHREPCLLVDFEGLKDFSARQIAETLSKTWPGVRSYRARFPGADHLSEVSAGYLARCMDLPAARRQLAMLLEGRLHDGRAVGFPAVLGYDRTVEVVADLQSWLGVPVFEIPGPPVSIPGLRMRNTFEKALQRKGVRRLLGHRVVRARVDEDGFVLDVGPTTAHGRVDYTVRAQAVVLATGRFLGGGLAADRRHIRESLFDLPVHQPKTRQDWHCPTLLDPRGHKVNRAGLDVDALFRPVDTCGEPVHPRLFAAGSILAHQDWMREKCGAGLSFGTSYAAVEAALAHLNATKQETP